MSQENHLIFPQGDSLQAVRKKSRLEGVFNYLIPAAEAGELYDSKSFDFAKRSITVPVDTDVDLSFLDKVLIGSGRGFVNLGQGLNQLTLEVGEKIGLVDKGKVIAYTKEINSERDLYKSTLVGKSKTGQTAEFLTDMGMMLAIPGGSGLRGLRFMAGAGFGGAIISGIQPTEDGSLVSRGKNATWGAAEGISGAYVFGQTAKGVNWVWKEGKVWYGIQSKTMKQIARTHEFRSPILFKYDSASLNMILPVSSPNMRVTGLSQATVSSHNANNINAKAAVNTKMRALQKAQNEAVKTKKLGDGRIRYYMPETPSRTPGPTRGSTHVTEYNPDTGQVRAWRECYDHQGNINRIHPKMIDGQQINGQHYPPTRIESEFLKKPRRNK
jgi:hypothetical protein